MELQIGAAALNWGHLPDGRFFIQEVGVTQLSGGQQVQVPVKTYILTDEEAQRLKMALMGIEVAAGLPRPTPKLEAVH